MREYFPFFSSVVERYISREISRVFTAPLQRRGNMWEGYQDSRPETSAPKAGKLDRCEKAKKKKLSPRGSEAFGDKVGGSKTAWRGQADNRPSSGSGR